MTSTVLLKRGRNYGIAVYVPKEAVLKEMAGKIEQVKPALLFWTKSGNFLIHDNSYGNNKMNYFIINY
jgi:hypothetical protein